MAGVAVLIAVGVVLGRLLPRWRPLAVPLALAGLLPLAVGGYRTLEPYDHVPDRQLLVDEQLGRLGSVSLGDPQAGDRDNVDDGLQGRAAGRGDRGARRPRAKMHRPGRGVGNGDNLALVEERHP